MRVVFSLVAMGLLLSACYNKNFNEPGQIAHEEQSTERIVNANYEDTWEAVQQVTAQFPVLDRDDDSNTERAYIVTDWIDGRSDVLYSGYGNTRIPYMIRYRLYIYVVGDQQGQQTQVKIENVEEYQSDVITAGVDFQGSVKSWIRTDSSTQKEARLLNQIEQVAINPNRDRF